MMQPKIKLLPEDLINKIAAGEVVERPASVVKELVENSIDAGATRIQIEIQEGGKKLIRIADNGSGMSKEEVELAIERHSTSKISSLDDLFKIHTLGFRGEALPSIASVSQMEILSSTGDDPSTKLVIDGGKKRKSEETGAPKGTTITIRNLFFNTPARLKFLKATSTEQGHILDIISRFILSYPNIAFKLTSENGELLNSPGSGKLIEAINSIYGLEVSERLLEVSGEKNGIKVTGLISNPTQTRINRTSESFFVNGRYIRNTLLAYALEEQYRTLIPNGRYPVAIINLEIPTDIVDVNVHPNKREVRFSKTQLVLDALKSIVFQSLHGEILKGQVPAGKSEFFQKMELGKEWKPEMLPILEQAFGQSIPESIIGSELSFEVSAIQPLIPLAQFRETYIITTDGVDLVLIDQHAAHERILYDKLSKADAQTESQEMLIPENLELSVKEAKLLEENLDYLKSFGFELEVFGKNSFLIRAVPSFLVNASAAEVIKDLLNELENETIATELCAQEKDWS
ncbi:MAG: DNA mismatch repair endonuclease MutL [Candidatus Saganbacteria bacterium]|nr:DNA mismatch repair endonuclease MutL [Candidatus Saganbacteria bacterium]